MLFTSLLTPSVSSFVFQRYSDKAVCACYCNGHDVDKEGVRYVAFLQHTHIYISYTNKRIVTSFFTIRTLTFICTAEVYFLFLSCLSIPPPLFVFTREQVASNAHARPGGKYTATGDLQSIHYSLDHMGRIYSIVTNPSFSVRSAFMILEEFQQSFQRDFGTKLSTASEESLSRISTPMLKDFCEK